VAFIFESVNITAAGACVSMAGTNDTLIVGPGVSLETTGQSAAIWAGNLATTDLIDIYGPVFGYDGIDYFSPNSNVTLFVNYGDAITADVGNGLALLGGATITTYGAISGLNSGITIGHGTINNYGTIVTPVQNYSPASPAAIVVNQYATINNYGSVANIAFTATSNYGNNSVLNTGSINAILTTSNSPEQLAVVNTGKISQYVELSGGSLVNGGSIGTPSLGNGAAISSASTLYGTTLVNDGAIYGSIALNDAGGADVVDSTYGSITGQIILGSTATGVVIGGQTGGTIIGGSGVDVLYANPTLAAVNNSAKTTLDGSAGNNWLYGDAAYTIFDSGDNVTGDYNLIFGGASQMLGVAGYTNNTVDYANLSAGYHSAYINLRDGYTFMSTAAHAVSATQSQLVFEDYLYDIPNVIGSSGADVVICDNGVDKITVGAGNVGGDVLYGGSGASSQDTFVFTSLSQSPLTNAAAVEGFKIGVDKIDLSALNLPPADFGIVYGGNGYASILVEKNPSAGFNSATDMIISVAASTSAAITAKDLIL
jgi:hypothetical protein